MPPQSWARSTAPLLAIRSTDPDTTFQGHDSTDIANALAAHAHNMAEIAKESAASSDGGATSFQGHDSADVANAIQNYVVNHQDEPWPQKFTQPGQSASGVQQTAVDLAASVHAVTAGSDSTIFSLSGHVHDQYWMSILLCIVWIVLGLFMLFFGWASFFWGCNVGTKRSRINDKAKKPRRFSFLSTGTPLAGGIGGVVVGFLFFSFLTTVITSTICITQAKSVSSTSFFVIWLIPGLLGAALAGHWSLLSRAFTGLLAGACFTLIVTAMFGIHTLIIRAIFISVCTSLITAPLLLPRRSAIHFHLLNICTSIIGVVTFLDGVALFAPPRASSDSWIDLWVLLFALDGSASEASASKKWGTSAFKGFIAAAVLGAVVGFLFEFVFHKHASEDPDMEWNNYLGSFTQRLESRQPADAGDRAGSFEPAPGVWQKLSRAFTPSGQPAAYGNISTGGDLEKSPLTNLPGAASRRQARRARSSKNRGGPAKFEALDKRHSDFDFDSDSDATEYDSDSSLHKLNPRSKAVSAKSMISKADADELADELRPLSASNDSKADALRLPRPPSYRTNSSASGSGSTGSGLSGTTINSSGDPSRVSSPAALSSPTRPSFSRHTTQSPPPPFPTAETQLSGSLNPSVPATPSLVNAITRIQAAQAQARAWYETRQEQTSSGLKSPPSDQKNALGASTSAEETTFKDVQDATARAVSPTVKPENADFQSWWGKEVKGDKRPSS
ncbi:hypothetical protein PANT_9d00227 [Moesziomyces antarcticus T-34]|uniref:TM7S3/TM198-like domain-containing protein n=1 Tax=Pseudozyma antarctica (strain T-34) TaxID=1151754 RepID=M9LVD9_PSEA3|nr:hypothetical protein PANT_9d00227 [Moesziomyces antarcticus T-34]